MKEIDDTRVNPALPELNGSRASKNNWDPQLPLKLILMPPRLRLRLMASQDNL